MNKTDRNPCLWEVCGLDGGDGQVSEMHSMAKAISASKNKKAGKRGTGRVVQLVNCVPQLPHL